MRKINPRSFQLATRSTARDINRQIVLNLVREYQPVSRADLARRMRVGRGVVTTLVNELIAEDAIYEGATGESPRGRKPTYLFVRTQDRLVVAIDVRFSQTYLMLSDFGGRQIAIGTFDTIFSPAALVAELATRIQHLLATHRRVGSCEGIGLVVPGMVDQRTGRVLNAPQLGWRNVDIRDALAERTGLPVHIENAPIACALAQMWMGRETAGEDGFVYLSVSDGVGAGVVINGEVVRGHDYTAGEFGHVSLDLNGPPCLCGARGCWEAYTSNLATLSRYVGRDLVAKAGGRARRRSTTLTITDVVARARAGEPRAVAAIQETARYLGLGLANVINALNPGRVFIGGEITAAWELIEGPVRAALATRALTDAAARTPITPEQAVDYPRLRGATALVAAPTFAAPRVA